MIRVDETWHRLREWTAGQQVLLLSDRISVTSYPCARRAHASP
jgi:hypothetical protein